MEVYEEVGIFLACLVGLGLLATFGYCVFAIDRSSKDKVKRKQMQKQGVSHSSRKSLSSSSSRSEIVIIDPDYVKSQISPEKRDKASKEVIVEVHSQSSVSTDSNNRSSSLYERTSKSINQPSQNKLRRVSEASSLNDEDISKVNQETLSHYEEYKSTTKIEDLRAKPPSKSPSLTKTEDLTKENRVSLSHYEEYKATTKTEELRPKKPSTEHSEESSIEQPSEERPTESPSWLEKLTNDNKYGMHPPPDLTKSEDLIKEDQVSLSHYEEYKATTKTEELRPKNQSTESSDESSVGQPAEGRSTESPTWLEKLTSDNKYGMHPPSDLTKTLELPSTSSQ